MVLGILFVVHTYLPSFGVVIRKSRHQAHSPDTLVVSPVVQLELEDHYHAHHQIQNQLQATLQSQYHHDFILNQPTHRTVT